MPAIQAVKPPKILARCEASGNAKKHDPCGEAATDVMPSSFVSSYIHIVFSTKERRLLINPEWEDRLFSYIGGIEDHTHVLAGLRSNHRLDHFIRDVKGDSSVWIHKEITKMFEWQKGYGAFSVSPTPVRSVASYIENQRIYHKKFDFKTEFVDLLEKSGLDYDEKYLW